MRIVGLVVVLCGCATPGDERWAGWSTFRSEIGGYQFRYLDPPLERVDDVPDGEAHVLVESSYDADLPPGLPELPPSYEIFTQPLSGGSPEGLASAKLGELLAMEHQVHQYCHDGPGGSEICDEDGPIESAFDLVGHEIFTVDRYRRFYRYVYFTLPTGSVLEVHAEANDDPHKRDMDDLVASFEAYP